MAITKKQYKVKFKMERYNPASAAKPDRETDPSFDLTNSNIGEDVWSEYTLATGQTDVQLPKGGVTTIKMFALKSDVQIKIKIDSADVNNIAFKTKRIYHESADGITDVFLTNDSGGSANISYILAEEAPAE